MWVLVLHRMVAYQVVEPPVMSNYVVPADAGDFDDLIPCYSGMGLVRGEAVFLLLAEMKI
jgi:hypothetical protein